MSKRKYIDKNFSNTTIKLIYQANDIIEEYALEGLNLTLRQLYYQFVSRDLLPNKQSEYKRLGNIISNARLAGLIDWHAIEDRTRSRKSNSHWESPGEIVETAARSFMLDRWKGQDYRPEVWIEKQALEGVISSICRELDVPYFACKGYNSQSNMWQASQRMLVHFNNDQVPVIIHLGDHDPSGIDMTRDIEDRQKLFTGGIEIKRIALNYDQVEEYDPPPNPAKMTDTRANDYVAEYGMSSWELDALEPRVIRNLIKETVENLIDKDILADVIAQEKEYIAVLENVVANWETL
ncbi:MAG: hypothetical protein V3U75_12760 [Methylococcaceae bacterium]